MCNYPEAPPFHVIMAMLSGTCVVPVLGLWVATLCCVAACVCIAIADKLARVHLMAPGSASTKRFMFLIMYAKEARLC